MKQQYPACQAPLQKRRVQSLLMLSVWMGLSGLVGLGAFTRSAASELTVAEPSAPAASNFESAAVVPEPVPAEPEPAAVVPEPLPVEPEPAAVAPAPEPFSSESIAPEPVAPAAPSEPIQTSEPYIDTKDYSVGATEPYTPPEQVVVNERSSGCQATLSASQVVSASLCGAPAARFNDTAPSSQYIEQPPAWASANSIGRDSGAGVSAQAIRSTLQYSAVPPRNLAVKPLTGANPLKWILNGERMIFPLAIPVDITSVFGWRVHPISGQWRFHSGTDLGAPMGTPVLAAYSGRVSLAEFLGGYGLSVLLDHSEGKQETRYAHLSEVFVKPGQWVQQGTVIGLVGSTGNSTGPHLHFETLQATSEGMVAVDPGMELQSTLTQLAKALQTARLTATTQQQPTEKKS
ncbi:M23 family metallopeptidase [Altericista sp. CCNU0014]|uniref:M23 family metallopeptidase n=1 Tax=Altericista sp. CCNU0014 TaxID=3082949 RepID=UPI0038501080